jgi:hypothetical protein
VSAYLFPPVRTNSSHSNLSSVSTPSLDSTNLQRSPSATALLPLFLSSTNPWREDDGTPSDVTPADVTSLMEPSPYFGVASPYRRIRTHANHRYVPLSYCPPILPQSPVIQRWHKIPCSHTSWLYRRISGSGRGPELCGFQPFHDLHSTST